MIPRSSETSMSPRHPCPPVVARAAWLALLCLLLIAATALGDDGDIDTGLAGGSVLLPLPAPLEGSVRGVAIRAAPDGKILVLGEHAPIGGPGPATAILYRLLPNGALDSTFGFNGVSLFSANEVQFAASLELGPNGTILVGGSTNEPLPLAGVTPFVWNVIRFNADGLRDNSFGDEGVLQIPLPQSVAAVLSDLAVSPTGEVVAVGTNRTDPATVNLAIAKITAGGTLDPSFGAGGVSQAQLGIGGAFLNETIPNHVLLEPDGRIVIAGQLRVILQVGQDLIESSSWLLARVSATGLFDTTFNGSGYRLGDFTQLEADSRNDRLARVARLANGSYIGSGDFATGATDNLGGLVRVTGNGALELGWGFQGLAAFHYDAASTFNDTAGLVVDPAGRLVIVGTTRIAMTNHAGYARILPAVPAYDTRLQGDGNAFFDFPSAGTGWSNGGDVDIDINGRILVLGTRHQPSGNRAGLRRLVGGLPFSDGFETALIEAWSSNVGAE